MIKERRIREKRPIARLVLVAAILLLGAVSAMRLPLAYLPAWSLPEITVDLRLGEPSALPDLTRRWVLPLESAIRAVGGVRGMAGEVDASGAYLRVRFAAASDAERKAARLESELAGLRRALPANARVTVWPVGQGAGDQSAVVWLGSGSSEGVASQAAVDRQLIETLRDLPEVRSVGVAGRADPEIWVQAHAGVDATVLNAAIQQSNRFEHLGTTQRGGQRWPVVVQSNRNEPLGNLPVRRDGRVVPLRTLADVELRREEPPRVVRRQGEAGQVLLVSREAEASPLALDHALRRTFAAAGLADATSMLIDEAAPLRTLLKHLGLGLGAATLLLVGLGTVLLGWRVGVWLGLAVPLAVAASLNAFWLAGLPLDATTLPALVAGVSCVVLLLAFRVGQEQTPWTATVWMVVAVCVIPIAVALAGGRLAPLMAAPVRAFVVSVVVGVGALYLLPRPRARRVAPRRLTAALRACLRNPWTVLLGVGVVAYLLLILTGDALEPRAGRLEPAIGDLTINLRFADGATLEQAVAQMAAVEKHLDGMEEITGHWSLVDRRRGTTFVEVRRQDRRLRRLRALSRLLETQLMALGSSARVVPMAGAGDSTRVAAGFRESLDDEAEVDDDVSFFRFILRHTDVEELERAHARVMDRLFTMKNAIFYDQIHADWARPSTRIELTPKAGTQSAEISRATTAIAAGSIFPSGRMVMPELDLQLRVLSPRSPRAADFVRQRSDLLGLQSGDATGDALLPEALFEVREVVASPTVRRQSGRFALPMTLRPAGSLEPMRRAHCYRVSQALRGIRLPPGTSLELPELNPAIWSRERLRMLAIGGALPLLLFALAVSRLSSFSTATVAMLAPTLGVAAATPWIKLSDGSLDEMTLLLLGAVLAGTFPLALESVAATARSLSLPLTGGVVYRWLARHGVGVALVGPAMAALFVVPGLGLDDDRHPWVLPLRVAGVTTATICLTSLLCLPVLLLTIERLRKRDRKTQRDLESPPAWQDASSTATQSSVLEVQRLSKVYGNGFQALHAVSFELEPGIVGLLGPNGAGKTTLLRLLCGMLEPNRGQVRFRGTPLSPVNLPEFRRRVGFLPQGFNAYEGFTGAEFLDYWAIERGISSRRERRREVGRVLELVGLEDAAGRKVRDFSGGMRRRVGIARALLGEPPIVIVDEPTTGLDVESRNRLRESLLAVAGERIIIFSTHIASDVAAAASRILLLDQGRLVFDGPAGDLVEQARGRVFEALIDDDALKEFSHRYRVTTRLRTLEGLQVRAVAHPGQSVAGDIVDPNLEEAYLALLGGEKRRQERDAGVSGSLLDLSAWDSRKRR